jgi:hypothetical protein
VPTPIGWRHADIGKDTFDRYHFLPQIELGDRVVQAQSR